MEYGRKGEGRGERVSENVEDGCVVGKGREGNDALMGTWWRASENG